MPKSEKQKLKIFYIADFLMRKTDDERDDDKRLLHTVLLKDIKKYLIDEKGIEAEEHSIRRDIDVLCGGKDLAFDPVLDVRGGKGKPIYLGSRFLPFEDLEVIAECVACANFISRPEAEELIEKLKKLCSEYQAENLTSEYIIAERQRNTKRLMLKHLREIKKAIKTNQKIAFIYTRRSTKDITKTVNRRPGETYIVSPFKIVLSDGHHYLIGYDEKYYQIRVYRVDRMENVRTKNVPREGKDLFDRIGISNYAKQTFGMFIKGNAEHITIKFDCSLLDTMLERFGGNGGTTHYKQIDDEHFTVKTFIVESENFYGWVCGLGEKAVIIDPPETAARFKEHVQRIAGNY